MENQGKMVGAHKADYEMFTNMPDFLEKYIKSEAGMKLNQG